MINPDEIKSNTNLEKTLNIKPEVLPTKFTEAPKIEVPPLKTEKLDPFTQDYLTNKSGLLQQQTQADVDTARTKLEMDAANLGVKSNVERQYATDIRSDIDANQIKKDEYPRPEFHPTKENLASLGALFSMVSTLGMIVGASGKMGANNSMNAMTGMLKGWQAGRKDLYEKELKEFDKEYKRITDLRNEIEKQLEKSIQLRGIDKEASYSAGQQAVALAGANSVLGNMINKGNIKGALDLLDSGLTVDFKVKEFKQKADEAKRKEQQANQGNFQILQKADGSIVMYDPKNPVGTSVEYGADSPEAKRFFGSQKLGSKDSALKPPDQKTRLAHDFRESVIPSLEKALPVLKRLQDEGKYQQFTIALGVDKYIPGNPAEQVFANDVEVLNLIRTLAKFRSAEFQTAGQALTRNEDNILKPLYQGGFRPYLALENTMKEGLSELRREQLNAERQYPGLRSGENVPLQAPQVQTKPMPTGEKLKTYATDYFNGDEQKAKDYLATQGYR
jgi:hypothetical protein